MEILISMVAAGHPLPKDLWGMLLPTTAVILALAALVWGVLRVRAWLRPDGDSSADLHVMLSQYREMHEQGELSDDEYAAIKTRLIGGSRELFLKSSTSSKPGSM
jgi:hypothetical protein